MNVILGATGKVGRATIASLRGEGAPVRAVVRKPANEADFRAMGCDVAVADFDDADALRAALEGATAAQIICPVPARAEDPAAEMRRTIDTITEALAAAAVPNVLAISDYGAECAEGTGVTLAFHYMESRLRRLPASLTFLRSAEHMQNWSRVLAVAAETGMLPTFHHPVTKAFPTISAPDLGPIAARLLLTPVDGTIPRIVSAEGPRHYTAEDVASMLSQVIGRPIVAHELPRARWMPTLSHSGMGSGYAALVCELFDAHNAGRIHADETAGQVLRGTTDMLTILEGMWAAK